jgi:hypothetical protein
LFPGGGLISYNSIFTTRSLMPGTSAGISLTALPTFSHEADFNFTWGFYRDFDLTVLIPVVTNHFEAGAPAVGGTGLGDAMLLELAPIQEAIRGRRDVVVPITPFKKLLWRPGIPGRLAECGSGVGWSPITVSLMTEPGTLISRPDTGIVMLAYRQRKDRFCPSRFDL